MRSARTAISGPRLSAATATGAFTPRPVRELKRRPEGRRFAFQGQRRSIRHANHPALARCAIEPSGRLRVPPALCRTTTAVPQGPAHNCSGHKAVAPAPAGLLSLRTTSGHAGQDCWFATEGAMSGHPDDGRLVLVWRRIGGARRRRVVSRAVLVVLRDMGLAAALLRVALTTRSLWRCRFGLHLGCSVVKCLRPYEVVDVDPENGVASGVSSGCGTPRWRLEVAWWDADEVSRRE